MPRLIAPLILLSLLAASPAHAIVKGSKSVQARYAVRLMGSRVCSGVVIARNAIVTAAHCPRSMAVVVGGRTYRMAGVSTNTALDDGRRVAVSGDVVIWRLATPLPPDVAVAPIGEGSGDSYIIAGYGTTNEQSPGAFGTLHEAALIPQGPNTLVDPGRTGSIGASACFGDSGGPVLRGGMLVGVITRATHPSPHLACGHLTRWAPIIVLDSTVAGGDAVTVQGAMADQARERPNEE